MHYLASVLPCNAGEGLNGDGTKRAEHSPPAVNELALTEPLNPKNLRVGLKRRRIHVRHLHPRPDHVSGHILGQVLVQRVQLELQVLRGLGEPERVEPSVAYQGSVQPLRWLGPREPHKPLAGRELGLSLLRWWWWG